MAGRKPVGIYPHGTGWKFEVKDPRTKKWKQLAATRERFQELGVRLKHQDKVAKSEAFLLKERYQQLLLEADQNNVTSTSTLLLSAAIEDFLSYQRNTPQFLKDKRRVLESFRQLIGDLPLDDIKKQHVRLFEDHLRGREVENDGTGKLSGTTVARYLRYVRTFFNYCMREGWLTRSPFANYQLPQDDSTPIATYNLQQLRRLVDHLKEGEERSYAIWMLAGFVGLGLRCMELESLDWEDFDHRQRFVRITKSKNLQSRRMQPFPRSLMPLLEQHRRQSGPMFLTQEGNRANLNQMKSLGRRIGKRFPDFTWQGLRRTYATLLQNAGVDSLIIDRLLGHSARSSSIRVSAQHYIGREHGFYRDLVDEALQPLGKVFATTGRAGCWPGRDGVLRRRSVNKPSPPAISRRVSAGLQRPTTRLALR